MRTPPNRGTEGPVPQALNSHNSAGFAPESPDAALPGKRRAVPRPFRVKEFTRRQECLYEPFRGLSIDFS